MEIDEKKAIEVISSLIYRNGIPKPKYSMEVYETTVNRFYHLMNNEAWQVISTYPLSGSFLDKYLSKIYWDYASAENVMRLPARLFYLIENRITCKRVIGKILNVNSSLEDLHRFKHLLDWDSISRSSMTDEFIDRFSNDLNWDIISEISNITVDFLDKYYVRLNITIISRRDDLTIDVIERLKDDVDWNIVGKRKDIPFSFIRDNYSRIDWDILSRRQDLTLGFIEEHYNKLHWGYVSSFDKLSERIIRKFKDKVDWGRISSRGGLSIQFLEEFEDRIAWDNLNANYFKNGKFIARFSDKFIVKNNGFVVGIDGRLDRSAKTDILNSLDPNSISIDLFIEMHYLFNWPVISETIDLSRYRIEEIYKYIDWEVISRSKELTFEFLDRFKHKLNWYIISRRKELTKGNIQRFKRYVDRDLKRIRNAINTNTLMGDYPTSGFITDKDVRGIVFDE